MASRTTTTVAQADPGQAAPAARHDNVPLGLSIIGLIIVLAVAVAYLWGKQNAAKRAESAERCPTCGAVRRGKFCPTCGTAF